jgi:hypothetical protein
MQENLKGRDDLRDLDIDGRLDKYGVKLRTAFFWIRIESSAGSLRARQFAFRFHKRTGIL